MDYGEWVLNEMIKRYKQMSTEEYIKIYNDAMEKQMNIYDDVKKLKGMILHFNRIYNRKYTSYQCNKQWYSVGDPVYYIYDNKIVTGIIDEIEDFRTKDSPTACIFYWVMPDNIKWYEKLIDKIRYFVYGTFLKHKVYFPNKKYFGHAVGRDEIYPTHKEAFYHLLMNRICEDMDKLQFAFVDSEYEEMISKPWLYGEV